MRLSSISLIAAALATIGSAIAAPGPLRARSLEDVNSHESGLALLERKVDGEFVDDLFIRTIEGLQQAAAARDCATAACTVAAEKAREARTKAWEANGKAKEAAAKATRIAKKATRIADRATWIADRIADRAQAANNIDNLYRNEHFKNLDTADLHSNLAAHYKEEAAHHTKGAARHRSRAARHNKEVHGHTREARNHTREAEEHRQGKHCDWGISRRCAEASSGQAIDSLGASQNAIDQYDVAIGRDRATIAAYDGVIAEMAAHYPHVFTPRERAIIAMGHPGH